jgi:hypothetical protein
MLVASNMHGYVKLYQFSDMVELRQFRAHFDAVMTLSISAAHRLLVTSGDEHIRVWSLDPFGWVGSFGVGRLWRMDDPDTWQSPEALEVDPVHFAPIQPVQDLTVATPRATAQEEETYEEDTPEKMIQRMDESKIRTIHDMMQLLDSGEDIIMSGRKVIFRSKEQIEAPMYPLTFHPPPPPRPAVAHGFSTWIAKFAPKSINVFDGPSGRPRIVRPSGAESSRRQSQI